MKKLTSLLLAVCLCLSLGGLLISCDEKHEHTYSKDWTNNPAQHWHACTEKDCTETADKADHTWNQGTITVTPTKQTPGTIVYACTTCGYERSEAVNYQPRTTVTAEEWANRRDMGDKVVIDAVCEYTGLGEEVFHIVRNGDYFADTVSTVAFGGEGETETTYNYGWIEGGECWKYTPSYDENHVLQGYHKEKSELSPEEFAKDWVSSYLPPSIDSLDAFTYDEETKSYRGENVGMFAFASLSFEDGRLVSFIGHAVSNDGEMSFEITYAYGTTEEISLPSNILG